MKLHIKVTEYKQKKKYLSKFATFVQAISKRYNLDQFLVQKRYIHEPIYDAATAESEIFLTSYYELDKDAIRRYVMGKYPKLFHAQMYGQFVYEYEIVEKLIRGLIDDGELPSREDLQQLNWLYEELKNGTL